jgi:hypothetical protein
MDCRVRLHALPPTREGSDAAEGTLRDLPAEMPIYLFICSFICGLREGAPYSSDYVPAPTMGWMCLPGELRVFTRARSHLNLYPGQSCHFPCPAPLSRRCSVREAIGLRIARHRSQSSCHHRIDETDSLCRRTAHKWKNKQCLQHFGQVRICDVTATNRNLRET